jgi:hypothetical protein
MSRARRSSRISGVLSAAALTLALASVAAASVRSLSFSGVTKQKLRITFAVAKGSVSRFSFHINDACPDKHILYTRVTTGATSLDAKGRFAAVFYSPHAPNEPTSIKGTIKGKSATGSITDTTLSTRERKLCHGRTTFTATAK